jgi:hypothetical protein
LNERDQVSVLFEWNLRFGNRERDIIAVALARLKRDLADGEHIHEVGGRAFRRAVTADIDDLAACLSESAALPKGTKPKPTGLSLVTRYWVGRCTQPTLPPEASFAELTDAVTFALQRWEQAGRRHQMWLVVDVAACEGEAAASGRIEYDCDTAAAVFNAVALTEEPQAARGATDGESVVACPWPAAATEEGVRAFDDIELAVDFAVEAFLRGDTTWMVVDRAVARAPDRWDPEDASVAFFRTAPL